MSSRSSDVEGRIMTGTTVSAVGDADEVELARMGYKQELKCVFIILKTFLTYPEVFFAYRRDLSLLQVQLNLKHEGVIQTDRVLINPSRLML